MRNLFVILVGVAIVAYALGSLYGTLSQLHCHEAAHQGVKI